MTTVDSDGGSNLGGKVGGRLAQLVSDATVATRARMGDHQNKLAQKVLADFTNHVSDEIRSVLGPLWTALANDDEMAPELRGLFRSLGQERGQAWAWIGGSLASTALGPGLSEFFANELGPFIQGAIAGNPHGIHSPQTAASMAARDIGSNMDWETESAKSGVGPQRFHQLVELAQHPVTAAEALDIARRGPRPESTLAALLTQAGMRPGHIDAMSALLRVPLSAEQLAAMWNRDIVSTSDGRAMAAASGTTAEDFDRLTLLGGEPPAPEELLLAWRRGIIDESDVDRALIQGPLRKEWIEVIKSLQWSPLPVSEAADAVNQGHLSIGDARRVATENGVRERDFDVFVANSGIPPGPQEALDWVNRGLISEEQFRGIFLESRIKNKYIDLYLKSRREIMPPETIRLMYSRHAITADDALARLMARGYSPEDAAIILNGAAAERTTTARDLTLTQVRDLYADRAVTAADALAMLTELGYDENEAGWIMQLADMARIRRFQTAAISRIRAGFLSGQLDVNQAVGFLDQLGIPPEQRDDAVSLWEIEASTITKTLTLAQTQTALKKGLIDQADFLRRLALMGYSDVDAGILLNITAPQE